MKRWARLVFCMSVLFCCAAALPHVTGAQRRRRPSDRIGHHQAGIYRPVPRGIDAAGTYTPISVVVRPRTDFHAIRKPPHITKIWLNGKAFNAWGAKDLSEIPIPVMPIKHGQFLEVWIFLKKIRNTGNTTIFLEADRIRHSNPPNTPKSRGRDLVWWLQNPFNIVEDNGRERRWNNGELLPFVDNPQQSSDLFYYVVTLHFRDDQGGVHRGRIFNFIASNKSEREPGASPGVFGVYADATIKVDSDDTP